MSQLEEKLHEITQQIAKGTIPAKVSVRQVIDWYGVSRRGANVNYQIRRAFERAGLTTQPDFEWAYIDEPISIVAVGSEAESRSSITNRIGALESANRKPVSIKPDNNLSEAFTIMLKNDFSQLPVMTTDREVKGSVTWKSIGSKLLTGKRSDFVRDYVEPAQVISAETSLFDAITLVARHGYVIIHAIDRTICGIVTASDLSLQLKTLAEPFILVGECESLLRRFIHGKFSAEQLGQAKYPADTMRIIEGVSDLTFGEYVHLLENPENWKALNLLSMDRCIFIEDLKRVKDIRNDVMHFNPEGVDPQAILDLQAFVHLLGQVRTLNTP